MAPPTSVSYVHFGFWILSLVPTPTSIGLRFVFPSEYLHRLHYDSMIGPALVYPRVPHGPWTYEPRAQDRTLSSPFFYFGLGICFVFTCVYFFYIYLGTPSVFILGSYPFLALVLVSPSAFISFNVPLCRNILGPSFSDPFPRV